MKDPTGNKELTVPGQSSHGDDAGDEPRSTTADEHLRICALLDELEGQDRAEDMRRTVDVLSGLIEIHFRREAGRDGLFETIRRMRPEAHRRLLALEQEHETLLQELAQLRAALAKPDQADDELRRAKSELVARMQAHERSENQLMLDAHCVDLGDSG